ncbi:hypothetical protein MILUP08_43331 [Micromonospora lupini str. Lupac 08]|uniref:Uncharacterized protein n=1 Tax=Micromonospora lupini str. Lupac 08 TaxID=1150864 RepID=I0L3M5_9ACTN|nr:hypothetical protein MILUP08_43331 [Micromonospora lupini str. Lupac 08]
MGVAPSGVGTPTPPMGVGTAGCEHLVRRCTKRGESLGAACERRARGAVEACERRLAGVAACERGARGAGTVCNDRRGGVIPGARPLTGGHRIGPVGRASGRSGSLQRPGPAGHSHPRRRGRVAVVLRSSGYVTTPGPPRFRPTDAPGHTRATLRNGHPAQPGANRRIPQKRPG